MSKKNPGNVSSSSLQNYIKQFYLKRGYSKVKIYPVEESRKRLILHVDEGRLGKIVILDLNEFETLRFKAEFRLEHKIYNRKKISVQLEAVKKKLGYYKITHKLIPVKEFNESMFQIDRQIISADALPFIRSYPPRFDLEISVLKKNPRDEKNKTIKEQEKTGKTAYAISASGSKGLIPRVRYYHSSFFDKDDLFEAGVSGGIFWGLDRKFSEPPRITFIRLDSRYSFAPVYSDFFTPVVKSSIGWNVAGRNDLGISSYKFWTAGAVVAPGFTFFKKFKINSGFGFEYATFSNAEYDFQADYILNIDRLHYSYRLIDTEARLEVLPIRLGSTLNKNLIASHTMFFADEDFQKFSINGIWDFEHKDDSIYSLKGTYRYFSGTVPFYHETSVKGASFNGLPGIFTRHAVSAGNEYRISIYRDYVYAGVLGDITFFEGNGYSLQGTHFGFAAGPTIRILVLDQFEFYAHYARDLMLPEFSSGGNLSFSLFKKW